MAAAAEQFHPEKAVLSEQVYEDLIDIRRLHTDFEETLGISHTEAIFSVDGVIRSYNPVLDRFHFERDVLLKQPLSETEKNQASKQWRANIEWQMTTNLSERFNVDSSPYKLTIGGEKLYFSDTKNQPLEEVYWRGVLHRRKESSPESAEVEREEAEFEGFLALQKKFTDPDTSIGTKQIIISPPGTALKTPYTHNFVDILELKKDPASGENYIQAMRYATHLSNAHYRERATQLDPQYYDDLHATLTPDDTWFLSHPITPIATYANTDSDSIHETVFGGDRRKMKYHEFQRFILTDRMEKQIARYLHQISQEPIDWRATALAFNDILELSDRLEVTWKLWKQSQNSPFTNVIFYRHIDAMHHAPGFPDRISRPWESPEAEIRQAGCGSSAAIRIRATLSSQIPDLNSRILGNSVAQFGIDVDGSDSENYEDGTCESCGQATVCGRCSKRGKYCCEPAWFRKHGITA